MFNPVALYGYLLSDMYLFMADITNPDSFVSSCGTWIGLDISRFLSSSASHPAGSLGRHAPKNGKSVKLVKYDYVRRKSMKHFQPDEHISID